MPVTPVARFNSANPQSTAPHPTTLDPPASFLTLLRL
jgi:hypothetical protein